MSKPSTKDTCGRAETDSEEEPAQPQKAKRVFRAWQPLCQWDPVTELEDFIESELMRIAKEKMTVAGVTNCPLSKFIKQICLYGK